MSENRHRVGTWTAAPAPAEGVVRANQTLRMNPRIGLGGNTFRMRRSNAYSGGKPRIGTAHIGRRAAGASVVPGSSQQLIFEGATRKSPTPSSPSASTTSAIAWGVLTKL